MSPGKVLRTYDLESKITGKATLELLTGVASTVYLINHTPFPEETIAVMANGYKGVYEPQIDFSEIEELLQDVKNTKLGTPLEAISINLLLKDVHRGFTHQIVRTRIGSSFVQESMRFLGYKNVYRVWVPEKIAKEVDMFEEYAASVSKAIKSYIHLKDLGAEDQHARGVLPTNILTSLFWSVKLNTLMKVWEQRWCCQADPYWVGILAQIKEVLPWSITQFLNAPIDRNEPCGFNASFDRPCAWRDRDPLKEILE